MLVAAFRGLECGQGFKAWKHLPDKRHNTGRCPSQATLSLPFLSRTPKPFCFSLERWGRGWLRLSLMGLGTAPRNSLARRAEAAGRRRGSHTYLAKAAGNRRGRLSRTRTPAPRFLREGRQCAAPPAGARGRLGPSTWRPRGSEAWARREVDATEGTPSPRGTATAPVPARGPHQPQPARLRSPARGGALLSRSPPHPRPRHSRCLPPLPPLG